MSNFAGWLIKFGDTILPPRYILAEGWKAYPNQRLENDAWRDAYADLHRDTADHVKTKITMTIRPLSGSDKSIFDNIIKSAFTNTLERKATCTYWNDEDMEYKTGTFYIPDIEYVIKRINADRTDVLYKSFDLTITEY